MKRPLKIALISLGSLVGLVVVAAVVLTTVVFTPSRLTPIVRDVVKDYVTCPVEIGEVELTLFSTFPNAGIRLSDVTVMNPTDGAPSDTVAHLDELVAVIDVMAYLRDDRVAVSRFLLDGGRANLYVAPDGRTNFDIVATDSDTTATAESSPLPDLALEGIEVKGLSARYHDDRAGLRAELDDVALTLASQMDLTNFRGDVDVDAHIAGVRYAATADSAAMTALVGNLDFRTRLHNAGAEAGTEALHFYVDSLTYADAAQRVHIEGLDLDLDHLRVASSALAAGQIPVAPADLQDVSSALKVAFRRLEYADAATPQTRAELGASSFDLPTFRLDTAWHFRGLVELADAYVAMGRDVYVDHKPALVRLGFVTDLAFTRFTLQDTHVEYAGERLFLDGTVGLTDAINDADGHVQVPSRMDVDMAFRLDETLLSRLWALVPQYVRDDLKDMAFEGRLNLDGRADVSMVGDSVIYNAFNVRSDIRDIDVQMGQELHFAANDNYVETVYPHGTGSRRHIKNIIRSSAVDFTMRDSTSIAATIKGLDADLFVSDRVLYGSTDIPFAASTFRTTHVDATVDDSIRLVAGGVEGSVGLAESNVQARQKQHYRVKISSADLDAAVGRDVTATVGPLAVSLSATYDPRETETLLQWSPSVDFDIRDAVAHVAQIPYPVELPAVRFNFNLGRFVIAESRVRLGGSDFALSGRIDHVGDWLRHKDTLVGRLDFTSERTDVYQLMDLVDGLGADSTAAVAAVADAPTASAPSAASGAASAEAAGPFIVPRAVDLELNTHIRQAMVGENTFDDLGGQLAIRDARLYLEEMGFSSKAARMQLTAMYYSDDPDHLFVGGTFHLLDVEIAELLKLVPQVDTIVPMLKSFDGKAEFHLAAETNLRSDYSLKMSTLKATAAIEGQDLTLLDSETFSTIAKYAMFSKKTRNVIDTLSVEMSVARRTATVYPMLLKMDKYAAVISGTHQLQDPMPFSYHISIADWPLPGIRPGINLSGDLENPEQISFSIGQSKYANMFRPAKQNVTQKQMMELKQLISDSLKRNVKPQQPAAAGDAPAAPVGE